MIKPVSFSKEHIRELQIKSKRDPILLERAVYAFGLLEALVRVGLPFIFKGGTCLMLLMDHPRRLSTDIDIIVKPGTNLEKFIAEASKIFPFQCAEEQMRIGKNNIEKRHFKFTYESPINQKPLYILLDVLFEENHYDELIRKEIKNDLLETEPEYSLVQIPSGDCILADKLTAFAPHTVGITLNTGKDMEVMKQFYDVTSLLDIAENIEIIRHTYKKIAKAEMAYRGIEGSIDICILDTFNAALCIASRGKSDGQEYPFYVKGIHELRSHIYAENYTPETAAARATKVMYLMACLLKGEGYERVENAADFIHEKLTEEKLRPLNYLRKADAEAYAYAVKTDWLLATQ